MTAVVNAPPKAKPEWNQIHGTASRPSQMCIRIQVCAPPSRQVRTRLRAESRPASTMHRVPRIPKVRPGQLPPEAPTGRSATYTP